MLEQRKEGTSLRSDGWRLTGRQRRPTGRPGGRSTDRSTASSHTHTHTKKQKPEKKPKKKEKKKTVHFSDVQISLKGHRHRVVFSLSLSQSALFFIGSQSVGRDPLGS